MRDACLKLFLYPSLFLTKERNIAAVLFKGTAIIESSDK